MLSSPRLAFPVTAGSGFRFMMHPFRMILAAAALHGAVAAEGNDVSQAPLQQGPRARHNPMLHRQGQKIVDGQAREITLRGVNLGGWLVWEGWIFGKGILTPQSKMVGRLEGAIGVPATEAFRDGIYDRFIAEDDIAKIAQAGFNCVRVPLHYRFLETDAGWQRLDRLMGWCERHRLYAVLDLHLVPGSALGVLEPEPIWKSERSRQRFVALWKAIATRYRNRETVAGYDLINEPTPPDGAALVCLHQEVIRAIREVDPDHLIIVEGDKFSTDFSMFKGPLDENSAYSFHMYTWFRDDRNTKLQEYHALAQRDNMPLWVGEFGQNTYEKIRSTLGMYEQYPEIAGWAFWTWKKACPTPRQPWTAASLRDESGFPGLVMVPMPKDWARTMNWLGSVLGFFGRPESDTIKRGARDFLEAVQFKNCQYNEEMERLLLHEGR